MAKNIRTVFNFGNYVNSMFEKAFSYLGIFFLSLLSRMPMSFLYFLANGIYFLLYHVFGYRRQVVRENLKNSFPEKSAAELSAIEKKFYAYLADLIVEIIRMNSISREELRKRFTFKQTALVESYFERDQGVLFCAAHYGNWEWINMAIGIWFPADNYAIYKPLSNPIFDYWFKRFRSRFGNRMVAMRQTLRAVAAVKDRPSIFCFGNDQAPSKDESQYWTTFLHQQSAMQLGIEKIAKKTDRPIFYLKVVLAKRGHYEITCEPICPNPRETAEFEITELHTRYLEGMIREEPTIWLWSHRRWKYKPEL